MGKRNKLTAYEEKLYKLKEEVGAVENILNALKNLKYSPGQVVYHKDEGVVIIRDYIVKDLNDMMSTGRFAEFFENLDENITVAYLVVSQKANEVPCLEKDLVPYNDKTSLLYEKPKS